MDGAIMNGKTLKVKTNNFEFGAHDRFVNILGCFKYKPNSNIYIIYTDKDTKYNVVYYGNGHVRQGVALCMQCRDKVSEEEIIKEYIFKVIQKQDLSNFEPYSLNDAEGLEIIGSTKLEIKPEVLASLLDKVMPKTEVKEEKKEVAPKSKKKKKSFGSVLLGVVIAFIILGVFYYFIEMFTTGTIAKSITCSKTYPNNELNATVTEVDKYNFNVKDRLENINIIMTYQFTSESYNNFFLRGLNHKYMKDNDNWTKDDETYSFQVMSTKNIDSSYDEPKNYEEAIAYYKNEGYSCTEEIEK